MEALGIDIGGTGIKGAPVDTMTGALLTERFRLRTPQPATPEAMTDTVAKIVKHFDWKGPVGAGFPAIIQHGVARSAANIDPSWIGRNVRAMFEEASGCTFTVLNDADVAGMAEMRFGAGHGRSGVVLVLTLGTGIGSALFTDGHLVPNTEFGHIEIAGKVAETKAADSARQREELSFKKWARRLDRYLDRLAFYLSPDLIIVGGGISKKHDKFLPLLTVDVEIEAAQLRNEAGIIGAAVAAAASTGNEPRTVVGAAPELQV